MYTLASRLTWYLRLLSALPTLTPYPKPLQLRGFNFLLSASLSYVNLLFRPHSLGPMILLSWSLLLSPLPSHPPVHSSDGPVQSGSFHVPLVGLSLTSTIKPFSSNTPRSGCGLIFIHSDHQCTRHNFEPFLLLPTAPAEWGRMTDFTPRLSHRCGERF